MADLQCSCVKTPEGYTIAYARDDHDIDRPLTTCGRLGEVDWTAAGFSRKAVGYIVPCGAYAKMLMRYAPVWA